MKNIKFGIVGFGNIGKRHRHRIEELKGAELVAICDIDKNKFINEDCNAPGKLDS